MKSEDLTGRVLAHYKIIKQLGKGGMGEVYVAEDTRLKRKVALKVLPSDIASDPARAERFQREAEAIAALNHPNIVTIHSIEEAGTIRFLTMEMIEGETLGQRIPPGGMDMNSFLKIAVPILEALSTAHERGILHRDLKPANIMVSREGRVKILDFGLARLLRTDSDSNASQLETYARTEEGVVVGTVPYMSPEQIQGRPVDQRADIYSVGVIFYEMLTGQRPFRAENSAELIASILRDTPHSPGDLRSDIPEFLVRLILRCMSKDPGARYQTARSVLEELQSPAPASAMTKGQPAIPQTPPPTTIAVLSFADLSPQKDQEYFCDGIAEELINALSRLDEIRVTSRTSAFQFKGKDLDIRTIGEQLNTECILEGSVRKLGNRLRITVQLINVSDGFHLWSEKFDREMEDIFAIQDEIALAVVKSLRGKITERYSPAFLESAFDRLDNVLHEMKSVVKKPTDNLDAYTFYLKGRYFWNNQTDHDLLRGVEFFQQAIERDPDYALAYSGLAACYALLANWGSQAPKEIIPRARDAVRRALSLDNSIAEAHSVLGCIKGNYDWNWIDAEKEHRLAFELNPNDSHVSIFFMACLGPQGKFDAAIEKARQAQGIDPVSPFVSVCVPWSLYIARLYDQAIQECKKGLVLHPDFYLIQWVLGLCYEQKGLFNEAIVEFEKAKAHSADNPLILGELGRNYALAGRNEEARAIMKNLMEQSKHRYVSPLNAAVIYIGLRESDSAFEWLEKAFAEGGEQLYWMNVNPRFDAIRNDSRFRNLLHRMNLS